MIALDSTAPGKVVTPGQVRARLMEAFAMDEERLVHGDPTPEIDAAWAWACDHGFEALALDIAAGRQEVPHA